LRTKTKLQANRKEIKRLRGFGLSWRAIGRRLGVWHQTVKRAADLSPLEE